MRRGLSFVGDKSRVRRSTAAWPDKSLTKGEIRAFGGVANGESSYTDKAGVGVVGNIEAAVQEGNGFGDA